MCPSVKLIFISEDEKKKTDMLKKFSDFQRKADMYFVYHSIQRFMVGLPFLRLYHWHRANIQNVYTYIPAKARLACLVSAESVSKF